MNTLINKNKYLFDYISRVVEREFDKKDLFFPNKKRTVGFENIDLFNDFAKKTLGNTILENKFRRLNYKCNIPCGDREKEWDVYLMYYKTNDFLKKYGTNYKISETPYDIDLDDIDDEDF